MSGKLAILALPVIAALFICGCATEQLRDTTVAVSGSATDLYYQMVLQNLARAYEEHGGLPWAMQLTAGGVAINDTDTAAAGYSEKAQAITPSAGLTGNRAWQRSWTTSSVTKIQTLQTLQRLYSDVAGGTVDQSDAATFRDKKICVHDFNFCSGMAPLDSISAQYGNHSAYVCPKKLTSLTNFTLLVIQTINAAPPGPSAPAFSQPQPLLNVQPQLETF